ncbi:hypothetical protein [Mesorhizobium sp. M0589]|uniref:hypothetical protein n=1 Tax=Mesorhizobium sp. M0589 TaxID=2956965 RepID=UPI00333C2BD0
MVQAFKLHGVFQWPPSPVASEARDDPAPGSVEIWSLPNEAGWRRALRWVPGSSPSSQEPLTTDHVGAISEASAVDHFALGDAKTIAVWIDEAASKGGLTFRGAQVIEEFGAEDRLVLQLPLANDVIYGNLPTGSDESSAVELDASVEAGGTSATYSGFRVFADAKQNALFALHLSLPLPVRQAKRSRARAFPLMLHYPANGTAPLDTPPRIDRMFGGWVEDDGTGGTGIELKHRIDPTDLWLGNFSFCERGDGHDDYGGTFAIYQDSTVRLGDYWPSNAACFVADVVNTYGFVVRPEDWLGYSENDPADLSLRFWSRDDNEPFTGLVYRVRVDHDPRSGKGDTTSDIRLHPDDSSVLRIKLAQELEGRTAGSMYFSADKDRPEVEGWLRTGTKLSADCCLAWDIQKQFWSQSPTNDWRPTVTLRLHWAETLPDFSATDVAKDVIFEAGLLGPVSYSFAQVRKALPAGEAGLPASFLPDLDISGKPPRVRFCLYGTPIAAEASPDGTVSWGQQFDPRERPTNPWRRPPMRLSLASEKDLIRYTSDGDGGPDPKIALTASAVTFFRPPGASLGLELSHDPSWPPTAPNASQSFFASFAIQTTSPRKWSGRLGSLAFESSGSFVNGGKDGRGGYLRIGGGGSRNTYGPGGPLLIYPEGRIAAELSLPLPVSEITPVTVDVQRFDRSGRPAPLLIDLDPQKSIAAGVEIPVQYWLQATETLLPREDRRLQAEIFDQAKDAPSRSYAVLSAQPFSVFRFTDQPIASRGNEETTSVAVYDGDDRGWQYKLVSRHYRYSLPLQVIGESADKPRRLEIHDLPEHGDVQTDGSQAPVPRPFVWNGKDGVMDEAASGLQRRAVEYKLTPSAELWIAPSDVARGYFMPEAAAHDIFTQFGAYGIGAALAFLRAEFLYGLPVGIDVSKESSVARGARVAEIEALVGRLLGKAHDTGADPLLAQRWDALREAIAQRPERLEIWARDLDSDLDFTPARFADGVRFALRGTALHRAPLIDSGAEVPPEGADAHGRWPLVGENVWPPVLDDGVPPPARDPTLLRHHPKGLSGGALWPVESLNLFNTLLLSPDSSGGAIERIALSPLGGDSTQKAEFLGGKFAVISETYNGRVQRQKVEVIGRIGALWHRAKHVVVFERTVNPSAQFAPKDDPEGTRSRRPILRKVREYVELLQPERMYPDFAAATARTAGFVDRVRFNSRIINVDSAWSSDVDQDSWQVPLWNKLAARERPQVYPMPDIAFVTVAEGDGDNPVTAQECLDPDQLYFFADFKVDTSDTDRWAPRLGIDYPNMPAAQAIADETDRKPANAPGSSKPGAPEPRRPPVTRILPGLRRFTWRLAPAAQKSAINAGRAGKPLYVGLESVSLMRATHRDEAKKGLNATLQSALGFTLGQSNDGLTYWAVDGTGAGGLGGAASTIADQVKAVKGLDPSSAADLAKIQKAVDAVLQGIDKKNLAAQFALLQPNIDPGNVANLASGLKSGALCQKLKDDATSTIKRKELLVRTAVADWVAGIDASLASGQTTTPQTKSDLIDGWTDDIVRQVRPLFSEASQDIAKIDEGVEKARAIVLDAGDEIDAVFARARSRLEQFRAGYDESKPWSPARRKAFRAGANAAVAGIVADVDAAIDEAASRLAVELGNVGQQIAGHIAKALRQLQVTEDSVVGQASRLEGVARALLGRVEAELSGLLDSANGTKGKLSDLIDKVTAHPSFNPPPKNADIQKKLLDGLSAIRTTADVGGQNLAKAKAAAANMDIAIDEAAADFDQLLTGLGHTLKNVAADVETAAQSLLTDAADLAQVGADDLKGAFGDLAGEISDVLTKLATSVDRQLGRFSTATDAVVLPMLDQLGHELDVAHEKLSIIPGVITAIADDVDDILDEAQKALSPNGLLESVIHPMIWDVLHSLLEAFPEQLVVAPDTIRALRLQLQLLADDIAQRMHNFAGSLGDDLDTLTDACAAISEGVSDAEDYLKQIVQQNFLPDSVLDAYGALEKAYNDNFEDAQQLVEALKLFDHDIRGLHNDVSRVFETANAYQHRVFDAVSNLTHGGLSAAPSNLLKLYSAVTSAPELAALKSDIDRIRSTFDELGDIIKVTETNAMFNRLGDELKALGLSIPFDQIGDRLLPADLSRLDIGSVFRNFGGAKLDQLFKGYKIPAGVRDAVKITHDFDKKQSRAWVQVDIAAPFPGRRSLFSLGIFKADFVDMLLTGRVRLEASSDQDKVAVTGFGHIATTLDAVVGGQSMVKFEKFGLEFTKEKGLDVQFDPKNAKLNPQFKWVQDFLSSLFPDLGGGLEWIRENGIPIGIQHDFAIPPLSLTFGTSGISNISIENHFKLIAFPDFLIADRFNLSSIDRPFIFSIFIIGGTGYLQIETEYNPIRDRLMVLVEAGAGGSAQLAFAVGPFIGQVFITVSGVLSYRKLLNGPGGGLSISMVLVITGQVDVCGIVTVGITLMLRMSYRDNGQVDADGTLTVTIRITRFFKLHARAQVNYKLRGGKSESSSNTSAGVSGAARVAQVQKLADAARKLEGATK